MIIVSKAINGISINGDEYLIDVNNEVMKFDDTEQAKAYLKHCGVSDEQIEEQINFNEEAI